MPRALITGVTGQDGSYLAEFLLSKGYQVAAGPSSELASSVSQPSFLIALRAADMVTAS